MQVLHSVCMLAIWEVLIQNLLLSARGNTAQGSV